MRLMATDFGFSAMSFPGEHIFISYNRFDSSIIAPIVRQISERFPVWYDNGLIPGDEWESTLIEKIIQSRITVYFVGKSLFVRDKSYMCDEYTFASDHNKLSLCVWLDDPLSINSAYLTDCMKDLWDGLNSDQIHCVKVFDKSTDKEKADAIIEAIERLSKKAPTNPPNSSDQKSNPVPKAEPKFEPVLPGNLDNDDSLTATQSNVMKNYKNLKYPEKIKHFIKNFGTENALPMITGLKLILPFIAVIVVCIIVVVSVSKKPVKKPYIFPGYETEYNVPTDLPEKVYFNIKFLKTEKVYDDVTGYQERQKEIGSYNNQCYRLLESKKNVSSETTPVKATIPNSGKIVKPLPNNQVTGWKEGELNRNSFEIIQTSSGRKCSIPCGYANTADGGFMGSYFLYGDDDWVIVMALNNVNIDTLRRSMYYVNVMTQTVSLLYSYNLRFNYDTFSYSNDPGQYPNLFVKDNWLYYASDKGIERYNIDTDTKETIMYVKNRWYITEESSDSIERMVELTGLEFD